jgi:hypothetical protein
MSEMDFNDLKIANELMVKLREGGADIKAVAFNAYKRKEKPTDTNSKILNWLKEAGRDFTTISNAEAQEVEAAFTKEVNRRLARLSERDVKNLKNTMNSILVSGLSKALLKIIEIINTRIESGNIAGGGAVAPLTQQYAKAKMKKHGFTKPIGVATGQLLDNLSQDVKNVKVIK